MRKNDVNAILVNQTKRRNTVLTLICVIVVAFIIAFSFFCLYFQKDEKQYVSYSETSDINYKAYLKERERLYQGTKRIRLQKLSHGV